ncbi:restriction endonuclease [Microcoleus sp. C2C3]|uniref:Eco57I restriction-modification methylase domain-containing protein n=1 Tax=unclassified Microcoleus TaxID=2642155 RepID=UPI002FD3091A
MSTARHHAEWLSLVEASGPFLSLPVLLKVFPSGLDAHDSEHFKLLRLAYEEWQDNQLGARPEKAIHRAWVEFVLRQTLELPEEVLLEGQRIPPGLQTTVAEQGETLRPDWVIVNPQETPNAGTPRLLVQIVPAQQDLEKPLAGQRWKASPATRMMELLHAANVRLGLVTNGEHWMLVNAPRGETTGFISWYGTLWLEEHLTLRAFRSLLGVRRFFGVDDSEILETLLIQSISDQQEVTDQLGYQVRRAVEVLVQALDRIDQDRNRTLLQDISEPQLYEAALTVMMRLVFLFSAEERKLIPSAGGEALYHEYYAVSTISAKLRSDADKFGEEVLERRSDAWCRLLATFRAVHGGIRHDLLDIPAYGGSLFDPDRFPFLEGRVRGSRWQEISAEPIPVNNRIVLHLLEALQILQIRVGGTLEPRRLSFRALDIEQIGHVYEGLLDHTAVRATSPVLGLIGTREREPEVALLELERLQAKGEEDLVKFVKEQSNKSPAALRKALSVVILPRVQERLRAACNNDGELYQRVLPFAGLIRLDTLEYPMVIPEGSVYVTKGSNRRETGTHYTPRSLTEPIVQYTLEPLVYEGVAEGKPKEQWRLKSAKELLQLKVCDMAMGSGAFLVQTCRYLAERLVEAWEGLERENPGKVVIAPEGTLSKFRPDECPIPKDSDERLTVARRIVAERCLYGVDKNPLAVEMAKLSLWLITLAKARPFTFLDHAFKWGDSLVGVNLEQLRYWNLDTTGTPALFADKIRREVEQVIELRRQIAAKPGMTAQDQTEKAYLLAKANAVANDLRDGCDLLVASYFNDLSEAERKGLRQTLLTVFRDGASVSDEVRQVLPDLEKLRPFHWELEFPEVFSQEDTPNGFSAIIGNPPFLGGKRIATVLGENYQYALKSRFLFSKGAADLCAYFLRKSFEISNKQGYLGLIATNTIAQGDTKEVGLNYLITHDSAEIFRAFSSLPWIGAAGIYVSLIWLCKGCWIGERILDGSKVEYISSGLFDETKRMSAKLLSANLGMLSEGVKIHGNGFIITPQEREKLIKTLLKYSDIIQPYLGGEDITESPTQSTSRYVINFQNWDYEQAVKYTHLFDLVTERVKPYRDSLIGQIHESRYWLFWDRREKFFKQLDRSKPVLVCSGISKYLSLVFVNPNSVLSQKLKVFAYQDYKFFATLQSSLHNQWAWRSSSTLKADLSYSNTDTFLTFPMPEPNCFSENLEIAGKIYYTHRQSIMLSRQEGLTKTYNRFHNADETAADIQQLRELHVEMDNAVAAAYGWQDIDLGHDFHETKQGLRYTISETARREVLDRLLLLNHERYAEEVAQGLHDKGKKKGESGGKTAKKQVSSEGQLSLF